MNAHKEALQGPIWELYCLSPKIGEERLDEYMAGTMREAERLQFEHHLSYCIKCAHEVNYMKWGLEHISSSTRTPSK